MTRYVSLFRRFPKLKICEIFPRSISLAPYISNLNLPDLEISLAAFPLAASYKRIGSGLRHGAFLR